MDSEKFHKRNTVQRLERITEVFGEEFSVEVKGEVFSLRANDTGYYMDRIPKPTGKRRLGGMLATSYPVEGTHTEAISTTLEKFVEIIDKENEIPTEIREKITKASELAETARIKSILFLSLYEFACEKELHSDIALPLKGLEPDSEILDFIRNLIATLSTGDKVDLQKVKKLEIFRKKLFKQEISQEEEIFLLSDGAIMAELTTTFGRLQSAKAPWIINAMREKRDALIVEICDVRKLHNRDIFRTYVERT